jgi:calcineurin-like phosphoesterase family protein
MKTSDRPPPLSERAYGLCVGYFFALEHANLIAYLTAQTAAQPRISRGHVRDALLAMVHGSDGIESLISRDEAWVSSMKTTASEALARLSGGPEDDLLGPELETLLRPLRQELTRFDVFGLVVDDGRDRTASDELAALAKGLAYSSRGHALILMPLPSPDGTITVLDPIPAFADALEHPDRWPGMVFWTAMGRSAMFDLAGTQEMSVAIRSADRSGLERLIATAAGNLRRPRRLLHLSDLHFGSKSVTPNIVLLEAHLHREIRNVDRVVITGDLFDSPRDDAAAQFRAFDASLERIAGKPPVVIPGNHDIRHFGNLGSFYEKVACTSWNTIVVDDEIGVNFACFNSSEGGISARGKISKDQLNTVGGALQNKIAANPRIEDHLTVALVHHHPYTFRTSETRTFVQRALAWFGMNEETFLEMEDAETFLEWCARWRVSAVLHGHKHAARHMTRRICPEGASAFDVTAIGCGSSLGAEGSAMSFVMLSWDERSRRWSTSFFESKHGGPFVRQAATSTVVPNA